jgi:hypothetical protein
VRFPPTRDELIRRQADDYFIGSPWACHCGSCRLAMCPACTVTALEAEIAALKATMLPGVNPPRWLTE